MKKKKKLSYPSNISLIKNIIKVAFIYLFLNTYLFVIFIYPFLVICSFFGKDPIYSLFEEKRNKNKSHTIKLFSDLQAKIALEYLKNLDLSNKVRYENCRRLAKDLKIISQSPEKNTNPSYLNYCIQVKNRKAFRKKLLLHGIDTQETWLHNCDNKGKSPIAENLQKEVIYIEPALGDNDIDYIIKTINRIK